MTNAFKARLILFLIAALCVPARAQFINSTGFPLLQSLGTNLNGSGIRVAQPEAPEDQAGAQWEVDPTNVPQPAAIFTYYSNGVSSSTFSLGADSSHADHVGQCFYGPLPEIDSINQFEGMATNVAHVDNFDADYFVEERETIVGLVTNYSVSLPAYNINDPVVNQSFIYYDPGPVHAGSNEQAAWDSAYDNYAAEYGVLFVSGAGNGTPTYVNPPATCYNGIGVGVYNGASSIGPTVDNGRCKPDITAIAPVGETSFSTPFVAGSAAVLMQAGRRGDGGADTNAAANMMTIKALLLNGAVKPADWTNSPSTPLDFRYGAGVLNVFNSYEEMAGGEQGYTAVTDVSSGAPHPPPVTAANVPVLNAWDFNTNTSSSLDSVNHYFFEITNGSPDALFTFTATLVWNRHQNETAINHLSLFLYNAANSNLVACSTSVVDNVQHVFLPQLPQGRYDLEVWKAGGLNTVSAAEPYALAWAIFSESLDVAQSGSNLRLSWPLYPAGFALSGTGNLLSPAIWSTNDIPAPVITNNENVVWLNASNSVQFFRLQTPDF